MTAIPAAWRTTYEDDEPDDGDSAKEVEHGVPAIEMQEQAREVVAENGADLENEGECRKSWMRCQKQTGVARHRMHCIKSRWIVLASGCEAVIRGDSAHIKRLSVNRRTAIDKKRQKVSRKWNRNVFACLRNHNGICASTRTPLKDDASQTCHASFSGRQSSYLTATEHKRSNFAAFLLRYPRCQESTQCRERCAFAKSHQNSQRNQTRRTASLNRDWREHRECGCRCNAQAKCPFAAEPFCQNAAGYMR